MAAERALAGQPSSQESLDIGSRLELFVDDYLIESMDGVRLQLHEPRSAGKVLTYQEPWEGTSSTGAQTDKQAGNTAPAHGTHPGNRRNRWVASVNILSLRGHFAPRS